MRSGSTHDSREVAPGTLFVAVQGFVTDGHLSFLKPSGQGAGAVLINQGKAAEWHSQLAASSASVYAVPRYAAALADVAAAFYRWPARELKVVGITGTKGKTTTTYLTSAVLEAGGHAQSLLSSAEFKIGGRFQVNTSAVHDSRVARSPGPAPRDGDKGRVRRRRVDVPRPQAQQATKR